jgi:hypothetical protein
MIWTATAARLKTPVQWAGYLPPMFGRNRQRAQRPPRAMKAAKAVFHRYPVDKIFDRRFRSRRRRSLGAHARLCTLPGNTIHQGLIDG